MTIDPNGWPVTLRATWSQLVRQHNDKTLITWARIVVGGDTARQQVLFAMDAIRPTRAARSRTTILSNGTAALDDAPGTAAARPWTVRIYYFAANGDKVYAEFDGLTEDRATALRNEYGRTVNVGHGMQRPNPQAGAIDAECWAAKRPTKNCGPCTKDGKLLPPKKRVGCTTCQGGGKVEVPPPAALHGYRQVVWPSERTEPIEVSQDAENAA
jgi:hypothetical protein